MENIKLIKKEKSGGEVQEFDALESLNKWDNGEISLRAYLLMKLDEKSKNLKLY